MKKLLLFLFVLTLASPLSGQVPVFPQAAATATSISGGGAGAQPYNTAPSTTSFVYPATDVNTLNLNGNRTDTYIPDGTPERPYKTLTQLLAGASSVTGPYVVNCTPTTSAYTYTGAVTFPAYQTTIIGNGCQWNITGNVTIPGVYFISNLGTNITGTLAYTSSSSAEKVRLGGSLTVNGGITTSGYDHFFDMSILANTVINVGAGSTPVFTNVVGTPLFKSAATSDYHTVLTIIDSQSLATGAYTNVDMSNGGLAVIRGFIATNNGTLVNINLSGSSGTSTTTANSLASVSAAWVAAGAGCTYIDNGSLYGLLTGTCLYTPSGLGMSAPAANTMTVQSGTTGTATFDSGTTGAVNVGTGSGLKVVTLGNSSNSSTQILGSYVYVGNGQTAGSINIGGSAAATGGINIGPGSGAQTISIATAATGIKTVNVGNTVSGSKVNIVGEIDGVAAGSGVVGQEPTPVCIARGSGTGITSASTINFLTLSLPNGDWDVQGNVNLVGAALSATNGNFANSITTTSATINTDGSEVLAPTLTMTTWTGYNSVVLPSKHIIVSATTPAYLVVNFQGTITSGTGTLWGCMTARRVH